MPSITALSVARSKRAANFRMFVFPRLKAGGYDLKPASLARRSPADWILISGKLY